MFLGSVLDGGVFGKCFIGSVFDGGVIWMFFYR